jgi:UDPglucose 6-dehydrogenase
MIGFAGLSHLGIVSSVAAASKGFEVVAYDADPALVRGLEEGRLPVVEPQLPELVAEHRSRLRWTASVAELSGCDLIYASRDVPIDAQNRSDLTPIRDLFAEIVAIAAPQATFVVLSQVPPGFTRALRAELGAKRRPLALCYQVETLVFGRAVERATRPERFIVGCEDPAAPLPPPLDAFLVSFGCPVLKMRYESAELAKIAINMFLVSSVSTTNMLSEVCEAVGADWSEIAPALRLDRRIGQHAYLTPGLGIAGGNLERDLMTIMALASESGADAGLVDAWLTNSRHRRDWVLRKLYAEVTSRVAEPVVSVWGLAYKENTASIKNSPALGLIESLRGVTVKAYDPAVPLDAARSSLLTRAASPLDACRGADALAVMTPWPEFKAVGLDRVHDVMRGRLILDPFGVLDGRRGEELGLTYFRLGASRAADEVPVW